MDPLIFYHLNLMPINLMQTIQMLNLIIILVIV